VFAAAGVSVLTTKVDRKDTREENAGSKLALSSDILSLMAEAYRRIFSTLLHHTSTSHLLVCAYLNMKIPISDNSILPRLLFFLFTLTRACKANIIKAAGPFPFDDGGWLITRLF